MTSKEMEARSGMPRANVRYYEAEGLLHPAREKNGYREYSENDLAILEKIQLLRRLGVSVEDLKALQAGTLGLGEVLRKRLDTLSTEQELLERVARVCGDLREENVSFTDLDAPRYLKALDEEPTSPVLPAADALPMAANPLRRLFARWFDWYLYLTVIVGALLLAGRNPSLVNATVLGIGAAILMVFVEPLLLHFTGTTPGKALLGLHLNNADGTHMGYSQGLSRMLLLAWSGLGMGVPIWSLIRLWRSLQRGLNDEPQPWDEDVAYSVTGTATRRALPFLLALAVLVGASETANCFAQLPPHRGELTVAEFAENFNRQAAYLGLDFGGELDAAGQWHKRQNTDTFYFNFDGWEDHEPNFTYTLEDGQLTGVTLAGQASPVEALVRAPADKMLAAMAAFVWAQEDAPLGVSPRKKLLAEVENRGLDNYTLHQGGVEITCTVEQEGLIPMQDGGYFAPEGQENFLRFCFSLTKERP